MHYRLRQEGTGSVRFQTFRRFIGSVRFGSGLFEDSSVRLGSVRTIIFPGSMRFGVHFSNASWLGPVRFGSFPRPVPAGFRIKGSVRFGSAGSVRFLIPSCCTFIVGTRN